MKKKNPLRNDKGFTLIEIIAVLIILGILAAVAIPKYFDLQDDAAKASLKRAVAELNARENMAWAKYKSGNTGSLPSEADITGGASGFGDFYVSGGVLSAPNNFSIRANVNRTAPNESSPGIWALDGATPYIDKDGNAI
jgi:prepilin-type N-terminal cleavage/methylation domain-containing protein